MSVFAQKDPPPPTLTVTEVIQQAASLDGKSFKLKFYYRDNILQLDGNTYSTRVYDPQHNSVIVQFPKEGLNYFKRLMDYNEFSRKNYNWDRASDSSSVHVYVKARALEKAPTQPVYYSRDPLLALDAFGKSFSKNISGEVTYRW